VFIFLFIDYADLELLNAAMARNPRPQAPAEEPSFLEIIRKGLKLPAAVMIVEAGKFIIILVLLILVYWFLKALGAAGYAEDRLRRFETIHYYVSLLLSCIFGLDLLLKAILSTLEMDLE
jgi:hypothetical protein